MSHVPTLILGMCDTVCKHIYVESTYTYKQYHITGATVRQVEVCRTHINFHMIKFHGSFTNHENHEKYVL